MQTYFECLQAPRIRKASSTPIVTTRNGTTVRMFEKGKLKLHKIPMEVMNAIQGESTAQKAYNEKNVKFKK